MKIYIFIIASLIVLAINDNRKIIYISEKTYQTYDFYQSKTYLFILQVKKPDNGILKLTFYEEYFSNFPSVANIYEYSNKDYSNFNRYSFVIAD